MFDGVRALWCVRWGGCWIGARRSASRRSKSFQNGTLLVLCLSWVVLVLVANGREALLVQSTTMFMVWRKRRLACGFSFVKDERQNGGGVRSRL